jgi:hypothetical protein
VLWPHCVGDERQGDDADQRARAALQGARRHQRPDLRGERHERARDAEATHCEPERGQRACPVHPPAGRKAQRHDRQRVAEEQPLRHGGWRVQLGADRRQGDGHDRHVERHQHDAEADDEHGVPAARGVGHRHGGPPIRGGTLGHRGDHVRSECGHAASGTRLNRPPKIHLLVEQRRRPCAGTRWSSSGGAPAPERVETTYL